MKRRLAALAFAVAALALLTPAKPEACGEPPQIPIFVSPLVPYDEAAFAAGRLDVVQPSYARWYLAQAYRVLVGGFVSTPLTTDGLPPPPDTRGPAAWSDARQRALGTTEVVKIDGSGRGPDYSYFENCTDEALQTAARTLDARVASFGVKSAVVADWVRAQDRVFQNCGGSEFPVLPEPAAAGAPRILLADRDYQIAAAHFYAKGYETAERLFEAIAADAQSPWRPWGRYLAARALIRRAMLQAPEVEYPAIMAAAEKKLRAVAADPAAGEMRGRAARLANYAAARYRAAERVHELARSIAGEAKVDWQTIRDYTLLMDRFEEMPDRPADALDKLRTGDELTKWIMAMQSTDGRGGGGALAEWKASKQPHWLIAAMWRIDPKSPDLDAILRAAGEVPRSSPAFFTVTFLRVRLLAMSGRLQEARKVLAGIDSSDSALPVSVRNLLRAEAFMLAPSLEALFEYAARDATVLHNGTFEFATRITPRRLLDIDAADVFSRRLPLAMLVEAARSPRLARSIRADVAGAAWTRAVLLGRTDEARVVAPILQRLVPSFAPDLQSYIGAATDDERHRAAILLMLRFGGIRNYVPPSTEGFADGEHMARGLEHGFRSNWWCASNPPLFRHFPSWTAMLVSGPASRDVWMTQPGSAAPYPEFLTAVERADVDSELAAMAALGTAPNYLADQAVKWALSRPTDLRAAEALARAVEGTRWGCSDAQTGRFSRQAFQTLHKLFPRTSWARRTRYWYKGAY